MNPRHWRKDLIRAIASGLALWLILKFLPQLFTVGWLLGWQVAATLIFLAIAPILTFYLIYLCIQYFRCSNKISIKLLAVLTALGIPILVIPQLWFQLLLLSLTNPLSLCNISLDDTIHFPDYSKTVYITNSDCLLTSYDTIYIQEGWFTLKEIGSTPSYAKESTRLDRSELVPNEERLEFKNLEIKGMSVNLVYELKTGKIITEKMEGN